MSEDDPLKPWRDRIEAGEPIATFVAEPPIRLSILAGGAAVQIDSPMGLMGFEQAGIQRMILAAPIGKLRAALEALENGGHEYIELKRPPAGQQ